MLCHFFLFHVKDSEKIMHWSFRRRVGDKRGGVYSRHLFPMAWLTSYLDQSVLITHNNSILPPFSFQENLPPMKLKFEHANTPI